MWIFAYARGITSRELARQCAENLAFRFLTDGQCPDHRTLSGFAARKRRLLRWVFAKTVLLGRQMGLVRLGLVAIDSVKLQADARASRKRTAEQLQETLGKLDAYLAEVEAQDQARRPDRTAPVADADTLPKKLRAPSAVARNWLRRWTNSKRDQPHNAPQAKRMSART